MQAPGREPSMEEILASIKKVIAEDKDARIAEPVAQAEPAVDEDEDDEVLELNDELAPPADLGPPLLDQSAAAVRGGALLIQRTSPEILDGYMRYYLRSVNRPLGSNLQSTFNATFSIPDTIRDAMTRQIDMILGGI